MAANRQKVTIHLLHPRRNDADAPTIQRTVNLNADQPTVSIEGKTYNVFEYSDGSLAVWVNRPVRASA